MQYTCIDVVILFDIDIVCADVDAKGCWNCIFSKILLIIIVCLLLNEIVQKFIYKIYTVRKHDGTFFVRMPH